MAQKDINRQYGGPKRKMVHVYVPSLTKDDPLLYHGEVIYRNHIPMGYIRSSSYGHTIQGGVGLSMIEWTSSSSSSLSHNQQQQVQIQQQQQQPITIEFIHHGQWEIDIAGKRYPCQVSLKPFYDPNNERIRM
jgi:glycine cleavage system aminomethyltransferase T